MWGVRDIPGVRVGVQSPLVGPGKRLGKGRGPWRALWWVLALGLRVSPRRGHYSRGTSVYGLWLVGGRRRYTSHARHGGFGGFGRQYADKPAQIMVSLETLGDFVGIVSRQRYGHVNSTAAGVERRGIRQCISGHPEGSEFVLYLLQFD